MTQSKPNYLAINLHSSRLLGNFHDEAPSFSLICLMFRRDAWTCLHSTSFIVSTFGDGEEHWAKTGEVTGAGICYGGGSDGARAHSCGAEGGVYDFRAGGGADSGADGEAEDWLKRSFKRSHYYVVKPVGMYSTMVVMVAIDRSKWSSVTQGVLS